MGFDVLSAPRAEFQALTRERDPELRGAGLLSLAGRQERAQRVELAVEIYREILSSEAMPASVRERAQRRLDAQLGGGRFGDRAEVLLSRFAHEATEPTTLLAMTVAGAAFRASRFLTLARLTSHPSANLLTRGLGARAAASLTGFGVEATVFPLAGRLGNLALGREQEWSGRAIGHELASSFLMLGALRAGGLATGALANPQSYFRPLAQQAGMFGGIMLGQELEVRAGLRERSRASIALVDGLSTLLVFNVAGRLNHGLLGEGMRRWEGRLEAQTQALSRPLSNPPLSPLFQRGVGLATIPAGPGRISPEPFGPDRLYMSAENGNGNGNGDGPRRPLRDKSNDTLPFITLSGLDQSPYHIQHPMEFGRRIKESSLGFKERIREVNVEFHVESIFNIEPFIPRYIDQLNRMLRQGELEIDPRARRQVIFNVQAKGEVTAQRIVLQRNAEGFERISDSEPPAFDAFAKTVFAMPATNPTPPAEAAPPEAAPRVEAPTRSEPTASLVRPKSGPLPPHLTLRTDRAEQVSLLLRQLVDRKEAGQGTPLLIAEGLPLERPQIEELTQSLAPKLHAHASFDLMIPELQQTYSGMRLGDRIHWIQQQPAQLKWQTLYYQAGFPRMEVQSVGELYQQIHAMGRKESRLPEAETVVQLPGTVLVEDIADFALQALNRYRVAGRRIRLELDNNVVHEFSGEQGQWRLESAGSEIKPPSRPPSGGADQYHTARWRTELNTFLQEPKSIVGRHHEFFLLSGVPMEASDVQAIRNRLQLGAGSLELLRLHDDAAGKVWTFQLQGNEWTVEERPMEQRIRWRHHGNHPQGAVEASDLMDLLRQLPSTTEGTEPLHVLMRGPWSLPYAVALQDVLNQSGRPSLRPRIEIHYESAQAEPRHQVYERNSQGEWRFLE